MKKLTIIPFPKHKWHRLLVILFSKLSDQEWYKLPHDIKIYINELTAKENDNERNWNYKEKRKERMKNENNRT